MGNFLKTLPFSPRAQSFLIFAFTLVFLLLNCDWDGYEGDDLNSIIAMLNLDDARRGLIGIYRYDWQPFGYQLGALVYALFGTPDAIFILPPLFIAASISILYLLVRDVSTAIKPAFFVVIILFAPEIIYTGLYYNSSAAGFMCAVLALYLAYGGVPRIGGWARATSVGLLMCWSVLFRFEFLLISLAILYVLWYRHNDWRLALLSGAVSAAFGLGVLLCGGLDLIDLFSSYMASKQEILEKSHMGGWDRHMKTFVLTTVLSPIGFCFNGIGAFWLFWVSDTRKRLNILIFLAALSPSIFLFLDLLSAKYAMPVLVFMPLLAAFIFREINLKLSPYIMKIATYTMVLICGVTLFISIEPSSEKPFIVATTHPRAIATHDGRRTWGAFLLNILQLSDSNRKESNYLNAKVLLSRLEAENNKNFIIEGTQNYFDDTSYGWVQLQLFLAKMGYKGQVVARGVVVTHVGTNKVIYCERVSDVPQDFLDGVGRDILL